MRDTILLVTGSSGFVATELIPLASKANKLSGIYIEEGEKRTMWRRYQSTVVTVAWLVIL